MTVCHTSSASFGVPVHGQGCYRPQGYHIVALKAGLLLHLITHKHSTAPLPLMQLYGCVFSVGVLAVLDRWCWSAPKWHNISCRGCWCVSDMRHGQGVTSRKFMLAAPSSRPARCTWLHLSTQLHICIYGYCMGVCMVSALCWDALGGIPFHVVISKVVHGLVV